jgi:hypothetical protein
LTKASLGVVSSWFVLQRALPHAEGQYGPDVTGKRSPETS